MPKNKICRKELPNGCSRSQISVIPKNWKQSKKITGPWRIFYTFFDPVSGKKQVNFKRMNRYQDLAERKTQTQDALDVIEQALDMGYNPFYKKIITTREAKYDIEEKTLFIPALKRSLERIDIEDAYRKHISYVIRGVEKAATHLGFHVLFIGEVRRKHIVHILDYLYQSNAKFSDNTFNRFRTDLKILFKELVRVEAIENNPIDDNLPAKQIESKERGTLSSAERKFINELLLTKYPDFHRYLNIFYHSGARSTELLRLKGSDVDLEGQRYKTLVKKGKKYRTVWRTIKDIALRFWVEQMNGCGADDYVFSKGLRPGEKSIQPYQIHKRWTRLIKSKEFVIEGKKTKIEATFYSLKHSATTDMVDISTEELAAAQNAHTSTKLVRMRYDVKQEQRQHEKIKRLGNKFV